MRKSLQNNAVTPIALCRMSDFVEDPTMSAAVAAPGSRSSTSAGSSLARSSSASSFGVFCVQRLDRRLLLGRQAGERSSQFAQSVGVSVRRLDRGRYGREILWQHAPAAIRSGHVAERVQYHAPPGLGRARQERLYPRPFLIRQIGEDSAWSSSRYRPSGHASLGSTSQA